MMEKNPVFKLTETMKTSTIQPIEKPEKDFAFTRIPINSDNTMPNQKKQKTKDMKTILLPSTMQIDTNSFDTCQRVRKIARLVAINQDTEAKSRHKTKWHFVSLVLLLLLIQGVAWGQTVNLYLQSTQSQPGAGGIVRDLSLNQVRMWKH
jgi:hypothetical protein